MSVYLLILHPSTYTMRLVDIFLFSYYMGYIQILKHNYTQRFRMEVLHTGSGQIAKQMVNKQMFSKHYFTLVTSFQKLF